MGFHVFIKLNCIYLFLSGVRASVQQGILETIAHPCVGTVGRAGAALLMGHVSVMKVTKKII